MLSRVIGFIYNINNSIGDGDGVDAYKDDSNDDMASSSGSDRMDEESNNEMIIEKMRNIKERDHVTAVNSNKMDIDTTYSTKTKELATIPEDVWIYHISQFLNTNDIVNSLSLCCKQFRQGLASFYHVDVTLNGELLNSNVSSSRIQSYIHPWKHVKSIKVSGINQEHNLTMSPNAMNSMSAFMDTLIYLDLSYSLGLIGTELHLLVNLKLLYLNHCIGIEDVSSLPPDLEVLDLTGCYKVENVSHLPNKRLRKLNLSLCDKISDVSMLPDTVEELDISKCWRIRSVQRLPSRLRMLNMSSCGGITDMSHLPKSLIELNMASCEIHDVSVLPPSVRYLNLSSCRHVVSLIGIPPLCEELNLSNCLKLSDVSCLADRNRHLRILDLRGCYGISKLRGLDRIQTLQRVYIPEHL